jgi:hypothetical protein
LKFLAKGLRQKAKVIGNQNIESGGSDSNGFYPLHFVSSGVAHDKESAKSHHYFHGYDI